MIGKLDPQIKDVTIIGAGYAGLLCAYRLLKAGYNVTIHEKTARAGGLISTHKAEHGLIESAAHSIRSSPEIIQLFDELDIPFVKAKTKRKYIYRDGKFRGNPFTLWEMFAAACYASFKKSDGRDLTLAEWAFDHMGQAGVDYAFSPMANGIYAAAPEKLDQKLAFPRLTIPQGQSFVEKIFKTGGSQKAEKAFVMAPRDGMESLIRRLADFVTSHPQGQIIFNSEISMLPDTGNIVITAPAAIAGQLIGNARLEKIEYAPMISATVFVKKSDCKVPKGIGVLMARGEDRNILGILFNSETFNNRAFDGDYASLTVMLGGTENPDILGKNDEDIKAVILSELSRLLNFNGETEIHLHRWQSAIPLYSKELRETFDELKTGWCSIPGHVLMGNYTGEVSIRGMCQSLLALIDK